MAIVITITIIIIIIIIIITIIIIIIIIIIVVVVQKTDLVEHFYKTLTTILSNYFTWWVVCLL